MTTLLARRPRRSLTSARVMLVAGLLLTAGCACEENPGCGEPPLCYRAQAGGGLF